MAYPSSQASLAGFSKTNDTAGFQNTGIDHSIQHDYYFSTSAACFAGDQAVKLSDFCLTGSCTCLAMVFGF